MVQANHRGPHIGRYVARLLKLNDVVGASVIAASVTAASWAQSASGPLTIHPGNPRYFADAGGKAIYLTGAHTWTNLQDSWSDSFSIAFDYDEYLDSLQQHHHNFMRMWREELPKYKYSGDYRYSTPHPWKIVSGGGTIGGTPPGSGGGDGGGPDPGGGGMSGGGGGSGDPLVPPVPGAKYDLEQFNQAYFDRLHDRVAAAGERGIYVSVMLFEGYGLQFTSEGWAWHPFNAANNVNGVNGDPNGDGKGTEINTLQVPQVTALQEMYVRKVIDTVNDLDNVLFEISNESIAGSIDWQNHFVEYVHQYEQSKPKQHPVLFTTPFPYSGNDLWQSGAEAISPGSYSPQGSYADNPPATDGSKVVMLDSDHIFGCGSNVPWIWKSFTRGMNVLYMDSYYDDTPFCSPPDESMRTNLGYTNDYAQRMDLAYTTPHGELASTGYCLANPGASYLVYAPGGGNISLDLSGASGQLNVEWFNRMAATATAGTDVQGGGNLNFAPPFSGDAVLFVFDPDATPPPPPPPGNIVGDLNGDGLVNVADLLLLLNSWGPCPAPPGGCAADLNGNGAVSIDDLLILIGHWTTSNAPAKSGGSGSAPANSGTTPVKPASGSGKSKTPAQEKGASSGPSATKSKPAGRDGAPAADITHSALTPVGWPFVPSAWNPTIVAR